MSRVVVVHVLEGEHNPIQCSDGFFWRQGAATQKLSRDELREFFRKESAEGTFFTVTFRPHTARAGTAATATPQVAPQVTPHVRAVLLRAADASTRDDLQRAAGIVDREHFRTRYMLPLLAAGWLAMTIPDRPRSSKQRYVVTPEGEDALSAFSRVAKDEEC